MHVLAIDQGSYSVKIISCYLEKKTAKHVEMRELVLTELQEERPDWTLEQCVSHALKEVIEECSRADTKIVSSTPLDMITTRFLTLPVKARKKAEQMLPFQLEEDIPFPLHECHYSYRLEVQKNQTLALVELARESMFAPYVEAHRDQGILPTLLTTEPSVLDTFYFLNKVAGPFCVLDIGHRSTKAYFFYNSKLISTHVSYVGGRQIDEMISQTYQISPTEAVIYKHQNSFVLTSSQYNDVDENQREFARLMDDIFRPLVADFQRWELGFRVEHGMKISQIFITGGSSNIKNITNWLTEKMLIKASLLETFEGVDSQKVDLNTKSKAKFTMANMMVLAFRQKNRLINLLSGRFAQSGNTDLPIHSFAFIATRVAAVTAMALAVLVAERFFLESDIKAVNAKIASLGKNQTLQLTPRERRLIATDAKAVQESFARRQKTVKQQISTLQSSVEIRALAPLVEFTALAAGSESTLTEFGVTDAGEISAVFLSENLEDLKSLQERFQNSSLNGLYISLDDKQLKLTITATE